MDFYADLSERFPVQEEDLPSSVILADLADLPAVEPVAEEEPEELAEVDISELGRGLEDDLPVESLLSEIEEESEPAVAEVQVDPTEDNVLSYFSYRVKSGDTISEIASRYGITEDTVISVNNIKSSRTLQVGQYLKIPTLEGILYTVKTDGETPATIAQKYSVAADKVAMANSCRKALHLMPDAQFLLPVQRWTASPSLRLTVTSLRIRFIQATTFLHVSAGA